MTRGASENARIEAVAAQEGNHIVEVWEASVRATHHFLAEGDIAFLKPLVGPVLQSLQHLLCIRDEAGRVAAFVAVHGDRMEALFVHPEHRGRGMGRRLATHAVNALGAHLVDVNEQNDQAVGFYLRLGFEVEGRSPLDGLGRPFPLLHMRLQEGGVRD